MVDSVGCLLSGPLLSVAGPQLDDTVSTRDAILALVRQAAEAMTGPHGDAMRSILGESLRDRGVLLDRSNATSTTRASRRLSELLERGVARGEVRPDAVRAAGPGRAGRHPGLPAAWCAGSRCVDADLVAFVDGFVMPAVGTD